MLAQPVQGHQEAGAREVLGRSRQSDGQDGALHGDHLVQPAEPISEPDLALISQQLTGLAQGNPQATAISLSMMNGRAMAEITAPDATLLHDIGDGKIASQIDEVTVGKLAKAYYAGSGAIETLSLISANPPREIGSRPLPLWRVDFDDAWGTTLYISATTGALATRRHTLWRVFDFVWMLHIMDYNEREDINNTLLRIVSTLAFLAILPACLAVLCLVRSQRFSFLSKKVDSWYKTVASLIKGKILSSYTVSLQ